MANESTSAPVEEAEEEEDVVVQEERVDAPAHHPSAPPDELFDISTTVDPSYIISLIRKLLPEDVRNSHKTPGIDASEAHFQGSGADHMEEVMVATCGAEASNSVSNLSESMDVVDKIPCQEEKDTEQHHKIDQPGVSAGEEAWEEYGCVLWDLAASKTHAELMVENLMLEVLLANLMISQSVRVTEIILGIIGNLACHEVPMKKIVSTNGLIDIIVDQLLVDDTQCLCEAFRLLTLALQSCERVAWAKALQPEQILCRILWVTENTLNPQLIEKSVGLLLAVLESQEEVADILLGPLMKLRLPNLLVTLFGFEMSKLTSEKVPERYAVLDILLRAIEALSVIDGHSQEISLNKDLFQLTCDLVKFPDKVEVANSCVTAGVLIANMLSDAPDFTSDISQDLSFLQGLFDTFPFASDDIEARSALWCVIARLLIQIQEDEMKPSKLHQYVSVLVRKSDLIEDDLLDHQLDDSGIEDESLTFSGPKLNARTAALKRITSILNRWTALQESGEYNFLQEEYQAIDVNIRRMLDCYRKYTE